MEERERKRTGIGSLKIRFNQRVRLLHRNFQRRTCHLVPADFERKQTLVNAERYTTPELKEYERKVLEADERIAEIERRLFSELRLWIGEQAARLRRTATAIAQLDVLGNFARLAASRNYTRPEFAGRIRDHDRWRPASGDRATARAEGRALRSQRSVSGPRGASDRADYRSEHGREIDLPAASGVDYSNGSDGFALCRRIRRGCQSPTGFLRASAPRTIWRAGGRRFSWR